MVGIQELVSTAARKIINQMIASSQTVVKVEDCQKILNDEKLYFNCIRVNHRPAECRSKETCQICKGKHHSSTLQPLKDQSYIL